MASTLAPTAPSPLASPAMLPARDNVSIHSVDRPPSIRSVASSTHSNASGVSLSRKPRIRPRSRTVTGVSTAPITRPDCEVPDLPLLDKQLVQEPSPIRFPEPEGEGNLAGKKPAIPSPQPRNQLDGPEQESQSSGTPTTHNTDLGGAETTFVETQGSPEMRDGKTVCSATRVFRIHELTIT